MAQRLLNRSSAPITIVDQRTVRVEGRTARGRSIVANDVLARESWLDMLDGAQLKPSLVWRLFYAVVVKRAIDIVTSMLLLVLLAPLLLCVTLVIIVTQPGPIFYKQSRVGRGNRHFTVYKFRTMIGDRRRRAADIQFPDRRRRHKSEGDPRVTRVGRFLRRTSVDELPQLLNVLRGDMSLVGPRPELASIVANYEDWQHLRHLVRPGITGWWQINGRSSKPMHENTELDIYYVEHVSLGLDIRIVARTLRAVARGAGAF